MAKATAEAMAGFLYWLIVMQFGRIEELISDRGPQFRSDLMREYCKLIGTQQRFTTAYHPQSNGKTKRANGTIGAALTKYIYGHRNHWDEYLDTAVWATQVRKQCGEALTILSCV